MAQRPTLLEALHSPEFEEILPKLVTYAARRLRRIGWAEGRDRLPSGAEAEELVSEAVEAALSGKRVWPDDMDLETFLAGVMWSQIEHRYAKEKRQRRGKLKLETVEERAAPSDDLYRQRELCAAIERVVAPDPDLHAWFRAAAAGGTRPAERAKALGWTAERERQTQLRLNRRLAAEGLHLEPGDVGPQPLPGGRRIRPVGEDS